MKSEDDIKSIQAVQNSLKSALPIRFHSSEPTFSNREFRPHKHKEFEIALFKSGEGVYKTMDKVYSIKEGDVFIFSTDEIHCVTNITSPMRTINIKFEPRLMWSETSRMFDKKYLQIFLNRTPDFTNRLDRANPHLEEIRELLLLTEKEFANFSDCSDDIITSYLLCLLAKIKRYFVGENDGFYTNSESFAAMEKAMDFIDAHFTEAITLGDIALEASMSRNYFCSAFKKLNGLSPWDYITLKRIEKAKDMLRKNSSQTMFGIAQNCGFSSTAGFNKAFKHCTGFNPTDFKRHEIKSEKSKFDIV